MRPNVEIKGARIHNLRHIDVTIPKNRLTVITGVSGSGKSSLAFDTLYEEGRKRYLMFSGTQLTVESEITVDDISGLSPTVAVEQRIIRQSNPRSTVSTRTQIEALLSMLFANFGVPDDGFETREPLEAAMFQKNSPKGMCPRCMGKGYYYRLDEEKMIPDRSIHIDDLFGDIQKLVARIKRNRFRFLQIIEIIDRCSGGMEDAAMAGFRLFADGMDAA